MKEFREIGDGAAGVAQFLKGLSEIGTKRSIGAEKAREVLDTTTQVGEGCAKAQQGVPAVTVEAGTRWLEAYQEVTVKHGRYVQGGGVAGWTWHRRTLSRGGSWYARTILGIDVHDLTGGFKCFRRRVLETLDFEEIHADGYGFQIEMTYRAARAGFRVVEIPIVFHDRRAGESKMDTRIAAEAVWKVPALRWRTRGGGPAQLAAPRSGGAR